MTSFPLPVHDEALRAVLAHMGGTRIDAALVVADTGLVALSLYQGRKTLLGIGIGPIVTGVGLLPRLPQGRAGAKHPLAAAMRAHLAGKYIRSAQLEDATIWITAESERLESANHFPVRLALDVGRHGSARLFTPTGSVVSWPPNARPATGTPTNCSAATAATLSQSSLESVGLSLVETSDAHRIESLRHELLGVVKKKLKRLEKRVSAVQTDLARLADVPRLQKIGTLLLSQGHTIARGTTNTSLVDWESKETLEVHLAPDKPAKEQAAEFFQKARRMQRGASVMQARLDETFYAIESIRPIEIAIRNAPADWNTLQEIAQQMLAAGLRTQTAEAELEPHRHKKLAPDERKPYHTFRGINGQTILVGRSSKDNDELVTRVARPHDLWLHAKNIRGAHVLVPLEKNHSCPADVLVDAATLAAHFSDARNEMICEVSYVERRYVRKLKKSAPGTVTTQREKVITLRVEKDRLSRLLRSKDES